MIGKIFTGQITNWNDPAIDADNSGANLPDQAITVVHRNDGSGTTNAFTTWLCSVSDSWKTKLGAECGGKEIEWPVGLGGQGNPGVTSTMTTTPGAIGYIELAYAMQNNISFGNVKNASGTFIEPTLDSVAAAANFDPIPDDLTFTASGSTVADAYPITAATWMLVYQEQDKVAADQGQAKAVVHFLLWALDKGGDTAKGLDYATLPDKLRTAALAEDRDDQLERRHPPVQPTASTGGGASTAIGSIRHAHHLSMSGMTAQIGPAGHEPGSARHAPQPWPRRPDPPLDGPLPVDGRARGRWCSCSSTRSATPPSC